MTNSVNNSDYMHLLVTFKKSIIKTNSNTIKLECKYNCNAVNNKILSLRNLTSSESSSSEHSEQQLPISWHQERRRCASLLT